MINVEGKQTLKETIGETEKPTTQKQYCQKYYSAHSPAGLIYEEKKKEKAR